VGTVLTVVSVLLLRAGELNSKRVSVVIVPLLVTVSATLASYAVRRRKKCRGCVRILAGLVTVTDARVMPVSQSSPKNACAMVTTSLGSMAMSKACGMAVLPVSTFIIDWCRASLVMMEALNVRASESFMLAREPRYAEVPTYSIARAADIAVETLVSTLEKSKSQVSGSSDNRSRDSCDVEAIRDCENVSPEADAHLENGVVGLLVKCDGGQLLDGDARTNEACSGVVVCRKPGEHLLIVSALEPLEKLREY
jgi:hypothetical protein